MTAEARAAGCTAGDRRTHDRSHSHVSSKYAERANPPNRTNFPRLASNADELNTRGTGPLETGVHTADAALADRWNATLTSPDARRSIATHVRTDVPRARRTESDCVDRGRAKRNRRAADAVPAHR